MVIAVISVLKKSALMLMPEGTVSTSSSIDVIRHVAGARIINDDVISEIVMTSLLRNLL